MPILDFIEWLGVTLIGGGVFCFSPLNAARTEII